MSCFLSSHKTFLSVALSASLLAGMTSCQDENFGYSADQIKYAKNFTELYGKIPADKSWDLTSWAQNQQMQADSKVEGTRSSSSVNSGRLNSDSSNPDFEVSSEEYVVPANLMSWMKQNLVEGRDNRSLGSSFLLRLPNNPFAIVPIFQGNSAFMSELEMKVNTRDLTKIWEKSQNMWAQESEGSSWEKLYYFDGWPTYDQWYPSTSCHGASTLESYGVKAKPIIFYPDRMTSGSDNDRLMYFSLRNIDKYYEDDDKKWDPDNTWSTIGDRLTSINSHGYMLAMPVPFAITSLPTLPNSGRSSNNVMIVGCEDANGDHSDHDTNDIVFMIVGYPDTPEILSTTKVVKKRYMCEDLGATEDFDFNDIVVDVTNTEVYKLTTSPQNQADNVLTDGNFELSWERDWGNGGQTARLAHVCGTLPFQVVVGDTKFPVVNDPTDFESTRRELVSGTTTRAKNPVLEDGWNPNEVKAVSGWNPQTNNIKIYVKWDAGRLKDSQWHESTVYSPTPEDEQFSDFSDGQFVVAKFPENGSVPYIIATDQDVPWMKECVNIPDSWVGKNGLVAQGPKDFTGAAVQGNRLNKPENSDEVTLWNGPFTCETAYSTGVKLNRLSEYHAAIIEAIENGYNVINVYTSGVDGHIGLSCIPSEGGWQPLTPQDTETYYPGEDLGDGKRKRTIYLTGDQLRSLKQLGVIVVGRTQNIVIERITMTKAATKELTLSYPRYGKIRVSPEDRMRYSNNGVPFEKAAFPVGSALTLTAKPIDGSSFVKWSDGETTNPRTITLNDNLSLGALFTNESDPQFQIQDFDSNGDPATNSIHVYASSEKHDLNFESMQVVDSTHATIVLDCDRWTEGFVLKTNSRHTISVSNRLVSQEVDGLIVVETGYTPDVKIKTVQGRTGRAVFEIWQAGGDNFDESVHIFVTVLVKQKSFVMTPALESIDLSYLHPNQLFSYTWIRQNKLDYHLKNNSGVVGLWGDSDNGIHVDAKKNGNDVLVVNYTGSDHYLGVYREIPVTVSDYSWDVCGMHLLRVNGTKNENQFTVSDGDMRLATQNWNYDKNIKVVVHFGGTNLSTISMTSSKNSSKEYSLYPLSSMNDIICKFNGGYQDENNLPQRSVSFVLSASQYKELFSGGNMIFNVANSSDLKPEFFVTETMEEPYSNIDLLTADCNTLAPNYKNEETGDNWKPLTETEASSVYGLQSSYQTVGKYDDLRAPVRYLKVVVYKEYAAPRFFFNYADTSGNDGLALTVGSPYISSVSDSETTTYYVNVEKFRNDYGKAYLNAITSSAWDTKIKVKSIVLGIPN